MRPTSWFDRLLMLLDNLDTPRIVLLREVVTALAAQRLAEERHAYPSIEAALVDVAEDHQRPGRWRRAD